MLRSERLGALGRETRLPRSVQAIYMRPLRRKAEYGLPVCDLQLRSYSVENVEFFADFAIRAAYYLNLPVSGPVPLPRIVERWTVPRSNFVHKKSQENFERITLRRLVQIKDGNPKAVQAWLAFLRKHAFYGVGMKANVWEHDSLGRIPTTQIFCYQDTNAQQMLASPWMSLFPRLRRPWLRTSLISVNDRMPPLSRAFLIPWTVTGLLSARTYRTFDAEECLIFALGESFWRPLALLFCLSRGGSLRGLYCISVPLSPGQWNKLEISDRCFKQSRTAYMRSCLLMATQFHN